MFPDQTMEKKSLRVLSKTLIGDDGRVYACSDNDFFSFESNGSIAWSVHMDFKCNTGFSPVYSGFNQVHSSLLPTVLHLLSFLKTDGRLLFSDARSYREPNPEN